MSKKRSKIIKKGQKNYKNKMEELVLKYREKIIAGLAISLVFALSVGVFSPMSVVAGDQADDDVSVQSEVMAWLSFSVGDTLNLGELVDASGTPQEARASVDLDIGTNNRSGWSLDMRGSEECDESSGYSSLYASGADYHICSIETQTDLSVGSDEYGAYVDEIISDWGGIDIPSGEPTVTAENDYDGSEEDIGPVPMDAAQILSADAPHSNTTVADFSVGASADEMTPSDDYNDEITLTAIGGGD